MIDDRTAVRLIYLWFGWLVGVVAMGMVSLSLGWSLGNLVGYILIWSALMYCVGELWLDKKRRCEL